MLGLPTSYTVVPQPGKAVTYQHYGTTDSTHTQSASHPFFTIQQQDYPDSTSLWCSPFALHHTPHLSSSYHLNAITSYPHSNHVGTADHPHMQHLTTPHRHAGDAELTNPAGIHHSTPAPQATSISSRSTHAHPTQLHHLLSWICINPLPTTPSTTYSITTLSSPHYLPSHGNAHYHLMAPQKPQHSISPSRDSEIAYCYIRGPS